MIIKKYKVPVELHYHCDKCKTEVEFTGETLTSNPAKYVHRCPNCNETIWLEQPYPCIIYEDKTVASDIIGSNFNMFSIPRRNK